MLSLNISKFIENLNDEFFYTNIDLFIDSIGELPIVSSGKRNKKFYNVASAFDIETSSFYDDERKCGIMYIWMFGLNGSVVIGRTWETFKELCDKLVVKLNLSDKLGLAVYVHNLSYEFQFICHWFDWESVFALDERKPCRCRTTDGLEFRCSYILTNKSLESVGADLVQFKVKKMVGDLDYSKIRNSETVMSRKEINYCINDVKVVMALIMEKICNGEDINKIPNTNTGYVRRFIRDNCLFLDVETGEEPKRSKSYKYRQIMNRLKVTPEEFKMQHRAFQGGFVHSCHSYTDQILLDVDSKDICSSYPATIINEMMPLDKGEFIEITNKDDLDYNCKYYCCVFEIELWDVKEELNFEHIISESHCECQNAKTDNGRIVSADYLKTTITNVDFDIIKTFYRWSKMRVGKFIRYKKAYLPKDFVHSILKLYEKKTTLKGVDGKEIEYMLYKGMLNSAYGMCVMNPIRPKSTFKNGEWFTEDVDFDKAIEDYNNDKMRFTAYIWGVFITAYARRNVLSAIYELGMTKDYVYSDTDSVKGMNMNDHEEWFERYNQNCIAKSQKAMSFQNLPIELTKPKTIKGESKPIGVFETDAHYDKFKTLGSKRYMNKTDGKISITVSGLNKKVTVPYLETNYNDVFRAFQNEMYIPAEYTGKMIHTYVDCELDVDVTDYMGHTCHQHERSYIHLEPCEYSLSLSYNYKKYLMTDFVDKFE